MSSFPATKEPTKAPRTKKAAVKEALGYQRLVGKKVVIIDQYGDPGKNVVTLLDAEADCITIQRDSGRIIVLNKEYVSGVAEHMEQIDA